MVFVRLHLHKMSFSHLCLWGYEDLNRQLQADSVLKTLREYKLQKYKVHIS